MSKLIDDPAAWVNMTLMPLVKAHSLAECMMQDAQTSGDPNRWDEMCRWARRARALENQIGLVAAFKLREAEGSFEPDWETMESDFRNRIARIEKGEDS